MEFKIAYYSFGKFIPDSAGKRYDHGFCKRTADEAFGYRMQVPGERLDAVGFWSESEGYGEFKQEVDMEIAEIILHRVKK